MQTFSKLVKIVNRLLGPDGCPWDKDQNDDSLKKYMLEEVYEIIDAIDSNSPDELASELGDLLLHIVFIARLHEMRGEFSIRDVINKIIDKMVRRHPHIFGDKKFNTQDEVLNNWAKTKIDEGRKSFVDGIPKQLPALLRAFRVQEKASHVGFDWKSRDDIFDKVKEEMCELTEAISEYDNNKIIHEAGDLLFAIVNLYRHLKIDPEDALSKSSDRFINRFKYIEERIKEKGQELQNTSPAEMERYWVEAKRKE